jgi:hypothetical protein
MVATDISLSPYAETSLAALVELGFTPSDRNAHGVFYYSRRQLALWTGASATAMAVAAASAALPYV